MTFNALNKTRLGSATPLRPCTSSAPVLGTPQARSDPWHCQILPEIQDITRVTSPVGTPRCRFAAMLHIWSTGTSGQLLWEGVSKQEGQGNSWRISEMSQPSPCPTGRQNQAAVGWKMSFSRRNGSHTAGGCCNPGGCREQSVG